MRGFTVLILRSFVAIVCGKEFGSNHAADAQQFMDNLVNQLLNRVIGHSLQVGRKETKLKVGRAHHVDLDKTTSAKMSPDITLHIVIKNMVHNKRYGSIN